MMAAARKTTAMASWRRHGVMAGASALFGATIVTSALGFMFWVVAARLAPPASVGSASAAVAAMMLLGSVSTLGLGTLLVGELSRQPEFATHLLGAAVVVSGAVGFAVGWASGAGLGFATPDTTTLFHGLGELTLFAAGTAITTVTLVVDQAMIGLAKGGWQLVRNTVFAVSKLMLLPILAMRHELSTVDMYGAWFVGNVLSLLFLLAGTSHRRVWLVSVPRLTALRGFGRKAASHHWMNVASHAPVLILPIVVTATSGAEASAAFYIALLIVGFAWIVPSHFSTALFAVAVHDERTLRHELRISLRVSVAVWLVAGAGLCLLGAPLLELFGSNYRIAASGLAFLGLATLPSAVKAMYIAVCRAQDRLTRAAAATSIGCIAEIVGGALGARHGITGACAALAAVMVAEAVCFWPAVGRAAAGGSLIGRHRRGGVRRREVGLSRLRSAELSRGAVPGFEPWSGAAHIVEPTTLELRTHKPCDVGARCPEPRCPQPRAWSRGPTE